MLKNSRKYLVVVLLFFTIFSYSQSWEGYFSYLNISEIVYSNDKIYATADNSIFSYDVQTQEIQTITTIDGLSGDIISTFHYSTNYQLLIIGYENGLIEIFNETTQEALRVVDIINKATIPPENKQINHFYEHQDELYISTNYGISVYRLDNLEFGDTFYIGNIGNQIPVKQTAVYNNTIYANCGNNEGIKSIALSNPNLIDYQQWFSAVSGEFVFLASNDGQLIVTSNAGVTFRLNDNNSLTQLVVNSESPVDVYFSNDYFVTILEASLKIYDTNFNLISSLSLPTEYQGLLSCSIINENQIFIGTKNNVTLGKSGFGVLKTNLSNGGVFEEIHPDGPLLNNIFSIEEFNQNLWVLSGGYSQFYNFSGGMKRTGISRYINNEWQNIPYDTISAQVQEPYYLSHMSVDPFDTSVFYVGSYYSGLIKFSSEGIGPLFDSTNSTLDQFANTYNLTLANTFDNSGNLWVLNGRVENPLNKYANGQWTSYDFTSLIPDPTDNLGFSDIIVNQDKIFIGSYFFGLIGYDINQGASSVRGLSGEDTANLPSDYIKALAFDKNNVLWIGTYKGLRVLYNTTNFFTEEVLTTSPIIILEDGLPKELLELQFITKIIVDGSNNKWVSTADSGVFYLSADGQNTIYHFTEDNSPLPSNTVTTMVQNENNGKIYFGTNRGLVAFNAGGSSPSNSLDEAYAYPNPVRPGFNLTIDKVKIKNLSDNVNIKITDVTGNLVAEAQSNTNLRFKGYNLEIDGGTAYWNGKNLANRTVASGVYVVLISDLDNLETKVLKIMLIRQ